MIYAVGATQARRLGVPGEDLPGSLPAATVVSWYNGHPGVRPDAVDLSAERVVVVGTGNVALDIARILTADPESLAATSLAPAALTRLRASKVREVVLLARRGPDDAAYTRSELLALAARGDLVVDAHDPRIAAAIDAGDGKAAWLRGLPREPVDWSAPPPDGRRVVLRFHSAPVAFTGDAEVRGVAACRSGGRDRDPRGPGRAGRRVPRRARGRACRSTRRPGRSRTSRGGSTPGTYVAGWIKRGPSGGIGANKACARETVGALLEDAVAGRLRTRRRGLLRR